MGNRKQYTATDGRFGDEGEVAVLEFLQRSGYDAKRHPQGEYGPDIGITTPDGRQVFAEVERRSNRSGGWLGDKPFPYSDINIPERRKIGPSTILVVVPYNLSQGYICFPRDVARLAPQAENNRYVQGEGIRKHDIFRTLRVDLNASLDGTLAECQRQQVVDVMHSTDDIEDARRTIGAFVPGPYSSRFLEEFRTKGYGCPFGMTEAEAGALWLETADRLDSPPF